MNKTIRAKRNYTARELGERFNRSPRTIRKIIAEPREDYLSRADEKRQRVSELRSKGLSIRAIARETGYSVGTVHRYSKEAAST